MSCNGCRVLRKGCSEACTLRPCLQWIDSADAQGHATVFVAKFFGRAGLMGFITAVPENQRPALFQSLLYEACGRTVNPVFGAVGLLWAGNWQVCQAAVETVLKGGVLKAPSPCSPSFCTLPQGPLHPSIPGKDTPAGSRGRDSLMPSVLISAKESTHDLCKPMAGIASTPGQFQMTNVYESKDHAAAVAKSAWDRKWDGNFQKNDLPKKQEQGVAKGNVKSNLITWSEAVGSVVHKVGEKRERIFSMGAHVLAPAPRRLKPCVVGEYDFPGGMAIKESLCDDQETVVGSTEHLDLGLTLKVKDGKGGQITGLKRVYSPCDSVNSEGSVTSLDTTPPHVRPSFSSPMFGGDMGCKLLPLLL